MCFLSRMEQLLVMRKLTSYCLKHFTLSSFFHLPILLHLHLENEPKIRAKFDRFNLIIWWCDSQNALLSTAVICFSINSNCCSSSYCKANCCSSSYCKANCLHQLMSSNSQLIPEPIKRAKKVNSFIHGNNHNKGWSGWGQFGLVDCDLRGNVLEGSKR